MYWYVLQVILAIVTGLAVIPVLIWLLSTITEVVENRRIALKAKLELARKQPPYDDVEVSQPPNPSMFTLRLVKNNEVVFEKSYKKEMEPRR